MPVPEQRTPYGFPGVHARMGGRVHDVRDFLDVREVVDGLGLDAQVDPLTGAWTGTDDTERIKRAVKALPRAPLTSGYPGSGGMVLFFPSLALFTDPAGLTIDGHYITLKGVSAWHHSERYVPGAGGILFAPEAGSGSGSGSGSGGIFALKFPFGGRLDRFTLLTTNFSGKAIWITGGAVTLRQTAIHGIVACNGDLTPPIVGEAGIGVHVDGQQGAIYLNHCHVAGYEDGVRFDQTSVASIYGGSELLFNRRNIVVGATGGTTLHFENGSVAQDPIECNLDIESGATVNVNNFYHEYGAVYEVGTVPHGIRIGNRTTGGYYLANINVRGGYAHGNANPDAAFIRVHQLHDGLKVMDNFLSSASGPFLENLHDKGSVSGITWLRNHRLGSTGTPITDYTGVDLEDESTPGVPTFRKGLRVGDAARVDTITDLFGTGGDREALTLVNGTAGWWPAERGLSELILDTASVGTTETTLGTIIIPGGLLAQVGDGVELRAGVENVAHVSAIRRTRIKVGSTDVLDTGTVITPNGGYTTAHATLRRRTRTVLRVELTPAMTGLVATPSRVVFDLTGLDFTSDITLTLTGQAGGTGAADGDLVARGFTARLLPASNDPRITLYRGMAEHWTFDEAGLPASHTGAVNGTVLTNHGNHPAGTGKIGNATTGDGFVWKSGSGSDPNLQAGTGLPNEMAVWANANTTTGAGVVAGQWPGSRQLYRQGASWYYAINDGTTVYVISDPATLSTGTYYQLRGVYDPRTRQIYLLVDNAVVASGDGGDGPQFSTAEFNVFANAAGSANFFDGLADDLTLYNDRNTTDAERAADYAGGAGLRKFPVPTLAGSGVVAFTNPLDLATVLAVQIFGG